LSSYSDKRDRNKALFLFDQDSFLLRALGATSMFAVREFVDAGGLLSFGVSFATIGRRTAAYLDRIAKGAKPADLPIEQPTKFDLVVNLKTAKAIGVEIPQSILLRADEVIE
jgi:putative ABC transport system substrate-binding protein